MAEVFLSYAREDSGRAKALASALERSGRSVWWDRNIEGGSEYSIEIDEELKSADAVVVLWSAHSVSSAWVRDEAAAGRDSNRLIPVKLDQAEPPLGFRQFQTIDLARWNGRDGPKLKTLKSAVAAKVSRSGKPGAEPAALLSPGQPRPRWMLAALAVAVLAIAALAFVWTTSRGGGAIPAIAIVRAPSGGDPARSDALARALSTDLGSMGSGTVAKFELRDTAGESPKDVDYLVEVAASPPGATATADLSLVSSKGRQILWTGHFQKPSPERDDLRPQAATQLQSVFSCLAESSGGGRDRLDQTTLKLYLRACEKFADTIPGLVDENQLNLLRQVVDRAPRFAPAIAHLALIEVDVDRPDAARALIAKAKTLDPKLPKIYLAQSFLYPRSKWRERQARLVEGLRTNPDAASLHSQLAFELSQVGLGNDGIASARRAIEIDPASPLNRATLIQVLTYAGRIAEAETELRKTERIWPVSTTIGDMRWAFDLRVGDPVRALNKLRQDESVGDFAYTGTRMPEAASMKLFLEARINPTPANIEKAIEAHRPKVRREPHLAGTMLIALAIFDRTDEAYAIIAHPETMKSLPKSSGLLFRSYFKKFRQDARFMPLAARIGLVRYWSETGKWPDFCFEPDLPYDCKQEAAKLQRAGAVR